MKFRAMLVHLDQILTAEEVKKMIFMSKDDIPGRLRENLTCLDFFEKLEERGKLSEDNIAHLKHLLEICCNKRTDVLDVLKCYVTQKRIAAGIDHQVENETNKHAVDNTSHVYLFEYLSEELGKDYCKFLRCLGVQDSALDRLREEHPRNTKEVIVRALEHWQASQPHPHDPVHSIIPVLKQIKRNDLARQVSKKYLHHQEEGYSGQGKPHAPQGNKDLAQKAVSSQVAAMAQEVQNLVISDGNVAVKN